MSLIFLLLNTLYNWFRPFIKWILRRTTKLCELQRICYGDSLCSLRTLNVEYSLDNTRSKELIKGMQWMNNNVQFKSINKETIFYGIFVIVKEKNINVKIHTRFPDMLGECLTKIFAYRQLVVILTELRKVKYDKNNFVHEKKLLRLWTALKPNEELKERKTKQWQSIGFQGDDPSTDFRGMGILGLLNLLFFAETHPSAAQHVLMRSHHPTYGYSFAIVGINITDLALTLVENGAAKTHFYNCSKKYLDVDSFHQFFCYLFFEFDDLWRREKPRDIMEFNRVRNKFEDNVRVSLKDPKTVFKCKFVENI